MSEEEIFSIDLVEAAIAQKKFLKLVDEHPRLYVGPHVQNAVRRYEFFWLPLLAQSPNVPVAAPLDIAWVWHVHMLSPLAYERDCNEIVSTLVDHKTIVGGERVAGLQKAKLLWHQLYGNEPFEVDLTAPLGNRMPHVSRIQYDIVAACSRQRVFNYQVSLPHYGDETFLRDALERYKQHLWIKQKHLNSFLVPCYDFDLIWHAHQVHPLAYRTDTMKILGRVLNHDDSVNDRRPGSKLVTSAKATIKIWKGFGLTLEKNGAMFRGEPPLNIAENRNPIDYSSMAQRIKCLVDVDEVEIQGLPKPKLYLVKISFGSSLGVAGGQIRQETKGPAASFHESSGQPLTTFEFNDMRKSDFIQVKASFCRRRRDLIFCPKRSTDRIRRNFSIPCYLDDIPREFVETPEVKKHEFWFDDQTSIRITTVTHPPSRLPGHYSFTVKPHGTFQPFRVPSKIPGSLTLFLPPASLACLPQVSCENSRGQLFDRHEREAFTYCVMHSVALQLSSVEVINSDGNVVSTAHLIQSHTLPSQLQVSNKEANCTLNEGERAFLVRGSKDWGICIGKWEGYVRGVPGTRGTRGIPGNPGYLVIKFFSLAKTTKGYRTVHRNNMTDFEINFPKGKWRVDLRTGEISFPELVDHVPESIALGFVIAMLHLLCQPYQPPVTPDHTISLNVSKPRRIDNENMKLVVAAGYYASTIRDDTSGDFSGCGGCGGCGGWDTGLDGGGDSDGDGGGCGGGCGGCGG